jgi:hypothetical protein
VSDVDFKPVLGAFIERLDEAAAEGLAAEVVNIPCSDISVEINSESQLRYTKGRFHQGLDLRLQLRLRVAGHRGGNHRRSNQDKD